MAVPAIKGLTLLGPSTKGLDAACDLAPPSSGSPFDGCASHCAGTAEAMPLECSLEREIKLRADLGFTLPDLRALVEGTIRLPEQKLWATYFDTPDLRLWHRGITLRHRLGDQDATGIWTLKLPQGEAGRAIGRSELTRPGPPDTVPDDVVAILRGIVRHSSLEQITEIETLRRRLTLQGKRDTRLGELDDDTVTIHGGRHDGRRFRQIELEVQHDDADLWKGVLGRLYAAGARADEIGPKLARALDGWQLNSFTTNPLGPKSSLGDVVRASIAGALDRILNHEYRLRVDPHAPSHDIHQTRVAARRLRADLKTFGGMLDPLWVRHTRRDLKWLGAVLGEVRDADVLAGHLDRHRAEDSADWEGHALLVEALDDQRRAGALELARVLDSDRYLLLLDRLHAATERPPFVRGGHKSSRFGADSGAKTALPRLIRKPWKKLRRYVKRAGSRPTNSQLHQIRIRAKQLRYAAEAAEPVIGKRARRTATAAEHLQTELGTHHDAVVAERWLRDRARAGPPTVAFSAGQLTNEQYLRQQEARYRWRNAWENLDRRSRRKWV